MSDKVEKLKVFSRMAIIKPHQSSKENGSEFKERMDKMRKEIPLIEDDLNAWLGKNPNVEIIKIEPQSHFGVAQPSTSSAFATDGWMCQVLNLFVTYREKTG